MKTYDIIVIGAGSGGLNVAVFMNAAGFKTLLIDKADRAIGGDCLNFGCVPSKALLHTAKLAAAARQAQKFGLKVTGSIDLEKVQAHVDGARETIRVHENAAHFKKLGLDMALGLATFASPNSVIVDGKEYTGKKIVIATGSRPRELDIPGIDTAKNVHTNETIFEVKKLPKKMVVIGGGPIGTELGQAFHRLGSEVTIVTRGSQFLPKEDPEIAAILKTQLESEGIKFMFDASPTSCPTPTSIEIKDKEGKNTTLDFDLLLVSIGRIINTDKLSLKKANIQQTNKGKIVLDDYMRTTNKQIYVVGDAAGSYQFTHCAELQARLVLGNFFNPLKEKISYDKLSWVTFTSPEIATFGINEAELKKRGISYKVLQSDFADDDRAICDQATYGKVKLYVEGEKLLGGTMIAQHAGELCQELILAQSWDVPIKAIWKKIYAYPTAGRINQKVIREAYKDKLTPFVKKAMKFLY